MEILGKPGRWGKGGTKMSFFLERKKVRSFLNFTSFRNPGSAGAIAGAIPKGVTYIAKATPLGLTPSSGTPFASIELRLGLVPNACCFDAG